MSNSAPISPPAETQPQLSRFELYKRRKAAEAAAAGGRNAAAAKNGGEEAGETTAAVADTRGRSLSRKRVAVRRRRPQTQ